jgi:hypothetical protein
MGGSQSKTPNPENPENPENSDTINWSKIKTDNVSSAFPNFNGLSNEAQNLIASLNIPEITESPTSEFTINHILDKISTNLNQDDKNRFNQLLDQVSSQTAQENDLSATSPFISSEMYNYLVKNESQKGGGKHTTRKINTKKGGSKLDDDSDTSSTSSNSSDEDLVDSTEEEVIKKKNMKKNKHNKKSDSELSGGELSYISSSAHTEGEFSNSHTSKLSSSESATTQKSHESSSATQSSEKNSTVTDQNGMQSTSISVNTEDINMVSDY